MTTTAISLGKFDIVLAQPVDDFAAGGNTGNRISFQNYSHITFVMAFDAGTDGDDIAFDLRQHTASSGGTSADLDIITNYYWRGETTLDGNEAWAKVTQTAASEVTAIATTAETENLLVFEVGRDQLSDGYTHISIDNADFGNNGTKWGVMLAICHLLTQREPTLLPYALTGANP